MKNIVKQIFQTLLGKERYSYVLTVFKIRNFKRRKKAQDFLQFLNLLDADDHVFDVGGGTGLSTICISKRVPKGKVYAFEAKSSDFLILQKIVKRYNCYNTQLYPLILSNQTKDELYALLDSDKKNTIKFYESKLYPFNKIESLKDVKISAIKISIENFEYLALESVSDLLKKTQPIIYAELPNEQNRSRCFKLIQSFKYKIFVHNDNQFQHYDFEKHDTQNFFFLK